MWILLLTWGGIIFLKSHHFIQADHKLTSSIQSGSNLILKPSIDDGTVATKASGSPSSVHYGYDVILPKPSGDAPKVQLEPLIDIVTRWNPDDVENIPYPFHEKLMVFNYSNPEERVMMKKWQSVELPFKIFNIPNVNEVVDKWTDEYLSRALDRSKGNAHVEESASNHFMYWSGTRKKKDWKPPTKNIKMSFDRWVTLAHEADEKTLGPEDPHYYFMLGTPAGMNKGHFVTEDLTIFSTRTNNDFVTNVRKNKGIQCRFGMRGIIAEAHYDSGKNMVAMLKGKKRYLLEPPSECPDLDIIPDRNHPSFRHSTIDWSDPKQAKEHFTNTKGVDTIVHEGEVLFIPSYWFHYPISLEYSIQCNTRSGQPDTGKGFGEKEIEDCIHGSAVGSKLRVSSMGGVP